MSGLTVDYSDLDRMIRKYDGADVVLADELVKAMQRSVLSVEAKAKEYAPAATGTLRRSITNEVKPVTTGLQGTVGTNVPYARYVEFGRGPGWPPVEPIVQWVRLKNRYAGTVDIRNDKAVRQAAFLVARKIARYGIEPRPYLNRAGDELWPKIAAEFRLVPRKVLARVTAP